MGDDVARPYRVTGLHLVLHLHRLEDADRLADFDRVAHVNQHLDDGALHGHGHDAGAGPGRCRFRTLGAGIRPGGGTAATGHGHRVTEIGHPQLHLIATTVDLGGD